MPAGDELPTDPDDDPVPEPLAEGTRDLPMFPLGSVLVPSMVLGLHVFEHRYRRLVRDCLDGTPEFGVVLIERGSEVGGGEVRTIVGTVARMVEAAELPDGRFAIQAVGTQRIRVQRWLDDAPYPRAEVEDWPDEPAAPDVDVDVDVDVDALRTDALALLRRSLALQAELGEPSPPSTVEVTDEHEAASHQIAALAPIGPHDRQALLAAPGTAMRLTEEAVLLGEAIELLTARLAMG
ncbi:LON peptidase substrate-binding domain-containing protein [Iamia sp.]|uniref:LON peptidase substrate-binding domain-containing protein n=1 Tax=Iamia sp. TaxID=2722710 RepID=UPI002C00E0DA|nr:LON peptidase substrate-binding domain-containing protein [Iamia sp.]HXH59252.1 LON peptidase substrate-binding domain-containing protein [Iamia sp.]